MARNLPDEVITEILSWLPVKSLVRFKCVWKQWFQLITTDPHFMKLHFNRSHTKKSSNPGILVSRKKGVPKTEIYYAEEYTGTSSDELTKFEIPFSDHPNSGYKVFGNCNYFQLVNVCNGLVCVADFNQKAYVWNPLTRDHITVPSSPLPSCIRDGYEGYPPYCHRDIMYGFGFNQASDEYKVIRFVSISPHKMRNECHTHVDVYTLGTGSWRTLQQFVPYHISRLNTSTALVNGALHWVGTKLSQSDEVYLDDILIAFNMQQEIFEEIPLPDGICFGYLFETTVGELGGLLSIFCSRRHDYVEILVMEEYGAADSWRRLCKIGEPMVSGMYDYLTPLGVAENEEIIINKNTWELISYDPNTNSVRDLHRFEFQVFDTYTFKGSLLSPTIINKASNMID